MTRLEAFLSRGYFPKELPPAFYTTRFAKYAVSTSGRKMMEAYKPADNFTECTKYLLALPGSHRRELRIPHPASYVNIAALTSRNLTRLLKLARKSKFAASRPNFALHGRRALYSDVSPSELASERAIRRAGALYLLKADVSQFYPSLYTHAVGWAIDPKLREKKHWKNNKLLGKQIDQDLMDLDGKLSQGIPIGPDVFCLLAEAVLSQVDAALGVGQHRAYRWFDDYEIAVTTRDEAEGYLRRLSKELGKFRLRLNSIKTKIVNLPVQADEEWQQLLVQTGGRSRADSRDLVKHFDTAFRLRESYPDAPVLLYAIGVLFGISYPSPRAGRIAQSCLSQAILAEPGAAQKAFALLSYWRANGFALDSNLVTNTIDLLVRRHESAAVSSDVAWAVSFCIEQQTKLSSDAAKVLSSVEDDCIALQALHMYNIGLLPKGFATTQISKLIKNADLDREHWLICYESLPQTFLMDSQSLVATNPLFADMLKRKVTFYRTSLPSYASVTHPGGAPEWLLRRWIDRLKAEMAGAELPSEAAAIPKPIEDDIRRFGITATNLDEPLTAFIDLLEAEMPAVGEATYPS